MSRRVAQSAPLTHALLWVRTVKWSPASRAVRRRLVPHPSSTTRTAAPVWPAALTHIGAAPPICPTPHPPSVISPPLRACARAAHDTLAKRGWGGGRAPARSAMRAISAQLLRRTAAIRVAGKKVRSRGDGQRGL